MVLRIVGLALGNAATASAVDCCKIRNSANTCWSWARGLARRREELRLRAARVTSLEYDHGFAARLGARVSGTNVSVIQGDAAILPFPDMTFSSAIAILMLHHLRSNELQDRAFAEIYRVLRPGGVFLAFEIQDGWLNRVGHIRSTFVPLAADSAIARLNAAGFSHASVDLRRGGLRIRALRARKT